MPATTIARFLTPEEVSEQFFGGAVVPDRIRKLSKTKGLPSHRVGRRLLYDADEVAAWVRSRAGDRSDAAESPPAPAASPAADRPVDPAWVAAQVAKFGSDDLRRAGELLLALSRTSSR